MHALDAPMAARAVGKPFDVERCGRDIKPRIERTAICVFRAIENLDQRMDVLETRLSRITFVGTYPLHILRCPVKTRFDTAMAFFNRFSCIPLRHQSPKILGIDDAEVIGDGIPV